MIVDEQMSDFNEERDKSKTYTQYDSMAKMQSNIMDSTSELIKMYLSKALNTDLGFDEVWHLNLDHAKNYKNYFNNDNPFSLEEKFNVKLRMRNGNERNIFKALTLLI